MKIKIEIKNRWTGLVIFEYEKEDNTIKDTIIQAIKDGANLYGANLTRANLTRANLTRANLYGANLDGANLDGANLTRANLYGANLTRANLDGANLDGANLTRANLTRANLYGANLTRANLYGANLDGANLTRANLTPYKDDFFAVLLRCIPEVKYIRANIVDGKIDGSTYDGACACLSGTAERGAKEHNGPQMTNVINNIMSCRSANRPIEKFFAAIKPGDTPENSQFSKLALEWLDEFLSYLPQSI